MSRLGDIGEAGFVARLRKRIAAGEGVVAGIGDDCAVVRAGDQLLLVTCDAAIEGVHFDLALAGAYDAGWRCAAGALSDIAAMGGRPRFVTLALGAPASAPLARMDDLMGGIQDAIGHADAVLVGGDTIASPQALFLDFGVIGLPGPDRVLLRSGAQPGDYLAVTGWPGRSAAGLHALRHGRQAPELVRAHLHPLPRIAEGQWLAAQSAVHAMTDVSDGLLRDAGHLAGESALGLDVHSARLPEDSVLEDFAQASGRDPAAWMLHGGEDYELAIALAPGGAEAVCAAFQETFGIPLHVVGVFGGPPGLRLDDKPATRDGYDHFSPAE